MAQARGWLSHERVDTWLASTLSRSWEGALIASAGARVRLDPGFREVHFGRWEGLTLPEIELIDPESVARWRDATPATGFDYPEGETAAGFEARIFAATDRMVIEGGASTAAVLHKGVIRKVLRRLGVADLGGSRPELGEVLRLHRKAGCWVLR